LSIHQKNTCIPTKINANANIWKFPTHVVQTEDFFGEEELPDKSRNKTKVRILLSYWWPGMDTEI
jgi:hypothetical protein